MITEENKAFFKWYSGIKDNLPGDKFNIARVAYLSGRDSAYRKAQSLKRTNGRLEELVVKTREDLGDVYAKLHKANRIIEFYASLPHIGAMAKEYMTKFKEEEDGKSRSEVSEKESPETSGT
jgi:hypothetical protein